MKYAQLWVGKGFNPRKSFLYYTQRLVTLRRPRHAVVAAIGAVVRKFHPFTLTLMPAPVKSPTHAPMQFAQHLAEHGYASLGVLFSSQQCADIHAFVARIPLSDRDRARPPFMLNAVPPDVRIAEYEMDDILRCPHILALANSPLLLEMAARFIGCKPTISGLRLRWSFPISAGESVLQTFHRDAEDWRYFKVMVYLTEVDDAAGPHMFVCGSHLTRSEIRIHYYPDREVHRMYGQDSVLKMPGPAGYGFAVDTTGLHKGAAPTGKARLMLQLQYSLLPCYAYDYEPIAYNGPLALDPYVNRLIIKH